MGIFSLFTNNGKYGGIIKDLKLENFYHQLPADEKEMLRNALEAKPPYTKKDLDKGSAKWHNSVSDFFLFVCKCVVDKNLTIKLCEEGLKSNDTDYVAHHLIRQELAEKYYQIREFDKCEANCKKDISEIEKYMNDRIYKGNPNVHSFKRLAILYEKQERYNEAIDICKLALKYKQIDGTKGGYEWRIIKLQKN